MLLLPIIILALFIMLMLGSFITSLGNIFSGGTIEYDEVEFQDYAYARYFEYLQ